MEHSIAITGATGLIGGHLQQHLEAQQRVVRPVPRGTSRFAWDPEKGIPDPEAWKGVDTVVHLAGATIAQRWTTAAKKRIWDSRVPATRTLSLSLAALDEPPKTLVSASAVGYYGDHPEPMDESGPKGQGFLSDLVESWEQAADPARDAGIRVVHPRTSIVLSREGGALPPLLLPAKLGAGGPIAGGKQWWPWIHIDDEVRALAHLIDHEVHGPVNLCAGAVRQKEFAKTLARVLRRPGFAPLPRAAVRVMFGDMGKELFEFGQNLRPKVLEETGFEWQHPDLEGALRAELGRPAK